MEGMVWAFFQVILPIYRFAFFCLCFLLLNCRDGLGEGIFLSFDAFWEDVDDSSFDRRSLFDLEVDCFALYFSMTVAPALG